MADSSLRFSVTVAADQAEKTLKAMTLAFSEAGIQAKLALTQVGPAAVQARGAMNGLGESVTAFARTQRSEARTIGFFAQELKGMGIESAGARLGLEAVGAMLLGGGVVGAIQVAVIAVRALAAAWNEEAEAARKAAEANARINAGLNKRLEDLRTATLTPAERTREEHQALQMQIEDRKALIQELEEQNRAEMVSTGLDWTPVMTANAKRIEQAKDELVQLKMRIAYLKEAIQRELENAAAKAGGARGGRGAPFPKAENVPLDEQDPMAEMEAMARIEEEGAKRAERAQKAYNNELDRTAAKARQWGSVFSSAVADVVIEGRNADEVMKGLFNTLARQMFDMAVTALITQIMQRSARKIAAIGETSANTAVAVSGSAAAVAGIPVIGPGLVPAAMAETAAAVTAATAPFLAIAHAGWDVPVGGPFPALLEAREMVLPQEYADVIRSGGSGWTVNVVAMDGASVERVFTDRAGAIAKIRRRQARRGRG